jgi:hypothetical protein
MLLHATAKLPLPPLRCRCCRCAATAAAVLPPCFPKRCHRRQSRASAKLPPLPPSFPPPPCCCCRHCRRCAATTAAKRRTAAKLPPLPPSCRCCCLPCRTSPRPFQPIPAGAHIDCCVFKGCNRRDPLKWAVRSRHGHLVPSQSLGQVSPSYFDWEKRATFPPKKYSTPSSTQPHVASDAFNF